MTIEGALSRVRNKYLKITSKQRAKKLKYQDFTIISNNCWGGLIYESYGLQKNSPTVGLYFMAEEYLKFLGNLKYYIQECSMTFIDPEDSKHKEFYKKYKSFGSYPIAKLGDVEIAMLHYTSEQEAKEKCERRCARINWNRLIVKMNDQNECEEEHANKFLELPFENKMFFTVKYDLNDKSSYKFFRFSKNNVIMGIQEPFGNGYKKVNVTKIINTLI